MFIANSLKFPIVFIGILQLLQKYTKYILYTRVYINTYETSLFIVCWDASWRFALCEFFIKVDWCTSTVSIPLMNDPTHQRRETKCIYLTGSLWAWEQRKYVPWPHKCTLKKIGLITTLKTKRHTEKFCSICERNWSMLWHFKVWDANGHILIVPNTFKKLQFHWIELEKK